MARANKLGETIDRLGDVRAQITALNKQADELSKERRALEADILDLLDSSGMKRASTYKFAASALQETIPTVTDWDALHEFIVEKNMPYLLQRRASVKPFQELFEAGEDVPGVTPYTQTKLYLKTL